MKTRKLLSIVISMAIIVSIMGSTQLTASATGGFNSDVSLHIISGDVPDGATDYAKAFFSSFTSIGLADLGFTTNEMTNLRLSPGFTVYEYDEAHNDISKTATVIAVAGFRFLINSFLITTFSCKSLYKSVCR